MKSIALLCSLVLFACSSHGSSGDDVDAGDAGRGGLVFLDPDAGDDAGELDAGADASALQELDASIVDALDGSQPGDAGEPLLDAGTELDAELEDAGEPPPPPNACGGTATLEHAPGSQCTGLVGTCITNGRNCAIDAEWTCTGGELVTCRCCEL